MKVIEELLPVPTEGGVTVPLNQLITPHISGCGKVNHVGKGYLHAADDDTPYDVDGCMYCGRCHRALD